MADSSRLRRRRRRRDDVGPAALTEEAVDAMRARGELSRVFRLPAALKPPAAAVPPPTALPPLVPPAVGHALCLADGTRAPVTTAGLVVGRRRSPGSPAAAPAVPRLEIDDDSRSLSREHARLVASEDGAVQVVDLGSGNGTAIRRRDGTTTDLVPGHPVALGAGDVLQLGGVATATLVPSAAGRVGT
jgi:hypothetical protein